MGKTNCPANPEGDATCGQGLTTAIRMFPKPEPAAGVSEILWWPCEGILLWR